MDARRLVTPKEGDRYSLRPPLLSVIKVSLIDVLTLGSNWRGTDPDTTAYSLWNGSTGLLNRADNT